MPPLRRLVFVVNPSKNGASALTRDLVALARSAGARGLAVASAQSLPARFLSRVDACCVIGGDGTLLGVAGEAARRGVPLIGVNQGSLGYLTTFSPEEARAALPEIIDGAYRLASRAMLECCVGDHRDLALNDVLIKDVVNSRLVRLEVEADGELVTDYYGDGLLLSTPTGSTAYNLSAGGPIIQPGTRVVAMTPICPHTLSNRTIIFPDSVRLRISCRTPRARLLVAQDGQRNIRVASGAPIEVRVARETLTLVQPRAYSHFSVMRTKLKWSGGLSEKK